ncbi:MAG: GFA family protein [Phenylobacterium sp.]|uniref:GFA family protein n=1 Tax=Phenylobacterium sp. TaxID=1871053 RepID=UPI002732A29C|nr:GFA family protein [Phenylobacterium sp.]MDP3749657.1 GFA family protein [Phenylobacterium sp.]
MSRLPSFPVTGGCACGAVRYEVLATPPVTFACCCNDCQTLTGSGFSLAMAVMREHFRITKGEVATWIRRSEAGNEIPQNICAHCGVRLYSEPYWGPQTVTVRAGTLDEAGWVQPAAAYYLRSKAPWLGFPEGTLLYETVPEDIMPVARRWREICEG